MRPADCKPGAYSSDAPITRRVQGIGPRKTPAEPQKGTRRRALTHARNMGYDAHRTAPICPPRRPADRLPVHPRATFPDHMLVTRFTPFASRRPQSPRRQVRTLLAPSLAEKRDGAWHRSGTPLPRPGSHAINDATAPKRGYSVRARDAGTCRSGSHPGGTRSRRTPCMQALRPRVESPPRPAQPN